MTDRKTNNPGQYKASITPAELAKMQKNEVFTLHIERDDQPITEGTPYNKESVLPDDVATGICPDIADPTPADAFRGLHGMLEGVRDLLMPVGYTFEWAPVPGGPDLSTAEKVATHFGFGTWEAYGAGRVLLGTSEAYAIGSEGGEAYHALSSAEMPSHCHGLAIAVCGYEGWQKVKIDDYSVAIPYNSSSYHGENVNLNVATVSANANSYSSGSGKAHNNMPPYVVVYRWRRIK